MAADWLQEPKGSVGETESQEQASREPLRLESQPEGWAPKPRSIANHVPQKWKPRWKDRVSLVLGMSWASNPCSLSLPFYFGKF